MKLNTLFVVLMVGSLALSACGAPSASSSSYGNSSSATSAPVVVPPTTAPTTNVPSSTPSGAETKVQISGFAFKPSTLEVKAGTTVTWTNEDGASHTVAADDGSFTSETLNQGESFSFTFDKAGSYSYHCGVHSSMKATIIVTP